MSSSSSLRRTRIAGAALALAASGLLLAPAPAQAVVITGSTVDANLDFTAFGGPCTESGTGDVAGSTPFNADGVPVERTATSTTTYTRNGDPTDVTTLNSSVTSRVVATQANGALRTVDITQSFAANVSATKGLAQDCDAGVDNDDSGVVFNFDLPTAKYVTISVESVGTVGAFVLGDLATSDPQAVETFIIGAHTTLTQRIYLRPGANMIGAFVGEDFLGAPTVATDPTSRSGQATVNVTFDDPGVATTAPEGDGAKYVDLAAGRTCAAGSVTGTWKSKAGKGKNRKIKKATFYVNDVKVASVKKPKKQTTTTLTGLVSGKPADVMVKIKLAKKGAGTVTVERSYLPCT
jgi:hypothetical protein